MSLPWWANPDIWQDIGVPDSTVEMEAVRNVYDEARNLVLRHRPLTLDEMCDWFGVDVTGLALKEALREASSSAMHDLPLREIHARRHVTLQWINIGTNEHEYIQAVEVAAS
jgi:hypothetical protein